MQLHTAHSLSTLPLLLSSQPSYHFEGDFAKGIPAGPCAFTLTNAFRCEGLPAAAAAHILAKHGPTLTGEGAYSVPAGVCLGWDCSLCCLYHQ